MTEERFREWLGRPPLESDQDRWMIGLASHRDDEWLQAPSWLFNRILAIGNAYRLSYLSVIARTGAESLSADGEVSADFDFLQSEAIIDELEFVGLRLNDPEVDDLLERLLLLATRCCRKPGETLRFVSIDG